MYDRLVIPRPGSAAERSKWFERKWDPDKLDALLEILRADKPLGHAITVPWNEYAHQLFIQRAATAKIVDDEANYGLTRRLLAGELLPEPPTGVARVAVVAAYPSAVAAEEEWVPNDEQMRRETLTIALSHQFLVPNPKVENDLELLRETVELADDAEFRVKRARMYGWLDEVIRTGITEAQALDEMAQYVDEYNAATKRAMKTVHTKFAFTLIPIAVSALAGPLGTVAAIGSVANLVRLWIFDRKPIVQAREAEAAAMFHAAHGELGWKVAPV